MSKLLESRRALVFGSSQGIGLGIAKVLLREGAKVVLASRNSEKLAAKVEEIGATGFVSGDLSEAGCAARWVKESKKIMNGLDIVVTNAGGPPKGTFEDLDSDAWKAGFQALFLSVQESMREAIPDMKKQNFGRFLLITSTTQKEPIHKLTVSTGIRPGLLGLAKTVSNELAPHGITVNSILPGITDTDRLKELGSAVDALKEQIPMKRLGTPEELGELVAFLSSDRANYITGQAIAVDGGFLKGHS